MLFAFASRRALKLLSCLLASVLAAPPGQPCGDIEELAYLTCYEPSCKLQLLFLLLLSILHSLWAQTENFFSGEIKRKTLCLPDIIGAIEECY
ncbi:hypothetical protein ACLKA7_010377 [Drosophila subpalustris]